MKRRVFLATAAGGVLLAASLTAAGAAAANGVTLTDVQMDTLTAGVGGVSLTAPPSTPNGNSGVGTYKLLPFKTSPSFPALQNAAENSLVLN